MERCKHCNDGIYYNDAAREWRHYNLITEHNAEPASVED